MKLNPGEAAILIIRRSNAAPEKYFLDVRRSESSFDEVTKDFVFSDFQFLVAQFGEPEDFNKAFGEAVAAIRKLVS
jgi:hypothetical protein